MTSVEIPNSVTSIWSYVFLGCSNLTSVEIGSSVTLIGDYAFQNCTGLTSVTYNAENCTTMGSYEYPVFYGCTKLANLTIGDKVKTIPKYAFIGCTSLTSVEIGSSVTSIGDCPFQNCTSLTSVTFNAENCTTMGSINCPVFYGCTKLANLTIGEKVKTIPGYAFKDCTGLTSVEIPNSVTTIGVSAFEYCTGLKSVEIPNSVTTILSYAFKRCTGLTSIKVDSENSNYKDDNGRALLKKDGKTLICYANKSGNSYSIPSSVTSIEKSAFLNCTDLTSVEIGSSVTSIGSSAFWNCCNLKKISSWNTTPPALGNNVFSSVDTKTCELIVPTASNGAYTTATGWKEFNKIITGVTTIDAENADVPVDVYSLQGALLRKQVLRSEATEGLYPGIYIVGGKKVIVK